MITSAVNTELEFPYIHFGLHIFFALNLRTLTKKGQPEESLKKVQVTSPSETKHQTGVEPVTQPDRVSTL